MSVDTMDSGNLAEITIFRRPHEQNRVKNILLNLASWHKEHRIHRAKMMKELEEFLKVPSSGQVLPPPVEDSEIVGNTTKVSFASAAEVEEKLDF